MINIKETFLKLTSKRYPYRTEDDVIKLLPEFKFEKDMESSATFDPKKQKLDASLADKILGFFGEQQDENQDFSNIDFKVNIESVVSKNDEMEELLSKMMKDDKFESVRKAKLSNQFGSVCLKANNFEKSG